MMMSFFATVFGAGLLGIGLVALVKAVLLAALAVFNAVLSILATLAIWKSYLAAGIKVMFTLLILVPVVGIIIYFFWGQKKVRTSS